MRRFAAISAVLLLCACSGGGAGTNDGPDRVAADIGDLGAGGASVTAFTTPDGYAQGDGLIAYEGPGWESDRVAYRLYLDGRNAVDIFGKRTPELVLAGVGRGEDYHAMADWGMDILKVGNSLGAGGFGVLQDGEAVQIGEAGHYTAEVVEDTNNRATVRVTHSGSRACGGDVVADYSISAGSRLTEVSIDEDCALPVVAGLVIHPGTGSIRKEIGDWGYIAQHGQQSLSGDDLGTAIFYRRADVARVAKDGDDHYVVFKDGSTPRYLFGAAWAQEPDGDGDALRFVRWLDRTHNELNEKDPT